MLMAVGVPAALTFRGAGPQRFVAGWLVGWLATRMHQVQRAADAETNPERRMLN